ncbi:MAG: peptide chain release factor N(5)-glutamine methyltransferase [Prolixibacteraceae bacterium]|nr:peptide chain release factor N(5)-glutamine methyltransferase [Prolixibacteraceae bacterium]
MQAGIAHIKKELAGIYSAPEINAMSSLVLQHVKSYSRTQVLLARNEILSAEERKKLEEITARLKKQEPIQYILGATEFFGLKFLCCPGALIPRPETEELVDWMLKETFAPGTRILDIGTGTGCIPVSLKKHLPAALVSACDISEACLQLAHENAMLNQTEVSFFRMDILQPITNATHQQHDVLVSNPPYVCESEKTRMQANVLDYEPGLALFVPDSDPLLFYRAILFFAEHALSPKGRIFWEINEALSTECTRLLNDSGYTNIRLRKDIHGKDRMISAQKP